MHETTTQQRLDTNFTIKLLNGMLSIQRYEWMARQSRNGDKQCGCCGTIISIHQRVIAPLLPRLPLAVPKREKKRHKCRVTHYFATETTMSSFFRNNHPAASSHFVFNLIAQHKSFQSFLLALLYLFYAFLKLAVTS